MLLDTNSNLDFKNLTEKISRLLAQATIFVMTFHQPSYTITPFQTTTTFPINFYDAQTLK
jgi:hypothetical protein